MASPWAEARACPPGEPPALLPHAWRPSCRGALGRSGFVVEILTLEHEDNYV